MTTPWARRAVAVSVLLAAVMSGPGCARSPAPDTGASGAAFPSTASNASNASGDAPSDSAKMICEPDAVAEIAAALGVQTSTPPTAAWSNRVYSCRYAYPNGTMVLSIEEFTDEATTTAYFTQARQGLTSHTPLKVIGQDGFAGPDGSLYVRKDFKVLHVDVSALPDHMGQPPLTRGDAAFTVAAVIMTCWTGD